MQRFLIIGSNSFSGSHFCNFLANKGVEVLATSRSDEPHNSFLPYKWMSKNKNLISFHRLDLNHDLERLKELLLSFKPSHIVNFAAQSMVAESWINPTDWMNTNILALTNLMEIIKNYPSLDRYIHITTPEVYGSTDNYISEGQHYNPSTPYAVSRATGDMLLKIYSEQYGIPVNLTRAANVYGPGQQLYRIIPRTILAALGANRLRLDGGGKSKRSFIHIQDVCEATYLIAMKGTAGETYHISTDDMFSIRDCVKSILTLTNKNFEEIVELGPERPGKDALYKLSSKKLRETLGWNPSINFDEGIKEVIHWIKTNLDYFMNVELKYVHKA